MILSKPTLFVALALLLGASHSAQAQSVDISGHWSPQRSQAPAPAFKSALRGGEALRGRSTKWIIRQTDTEIRVTEERRAGGQVKTTRYVLTTTGQAQSLNRFGQEETVTAAWSGGQLIVEAPDEWRETWELIDADSLRIHRQNLRRPVRQRELVLDRLESPP